MAEQLILDGIPVAKSHTSRIFTHYDKLVARQKFNHCAAWIRKNEFAWQWIQKQFVRDAKKGRDVGGNYLTNLCRTYDVVGGDGKNVRISNNNNAILARKLKLLYPQFAEKVNTAKSIWDLPEFEELIAAL